MQSRLAGPGSVGYRSKEGSRQRWPRPEGRQGWQAQHGHHRHDEGDDFSSLCKALKGNGSPDIAKVMKVMISPLVVTACNKRERPRSVYGRYCGRPYGWARERLSFQWLRKGVFLRPREINSLVHFWPSSSWMPGIASSTGPFSCSPQRSSGQSSGLRTSLCLGSTQPFHPFRDLHGISRLVTPLLALHGHQEFVLDEHS